MIGDLGTGGDFIVGGRMAINSATSSYNKLKIGADQPSPALYIEGNGYNPEIAFGNGANHWGIYFDVPTGELRLWYDGANRLMLNASGTLMISGTMSGDSIADGTIDSSEIENNSIFAEDIAASAIGSSELGSNSINSSKILDGEVTSADIDDGTIVYADTNIDSIQRRVFDSCTEGHYIQTINNDGTVDCKEDVGTVYDYSTCSYSSNNICTAGNLMMGYDQVSMQAYCCGPSSAPCSPTSWTNIASTEWCDVSSACSSYECGIVNNGDERVDQSRTLTDCNTEYRYNIDTGNSCSGSCGGCGTDEYCDRSHQCVGVWDGSTPYLFTNIAGNNYIENDVMATFWDVDYTKAKGMYEDSLARETEFSNNKYRQTDYYIMANNPSIKDGKIKLNIKELEPEESHIDQVKLARVLYSEDSKLIVDNQTNQIKSVESREMNDSISSCLFSSTEGENGECLGEISNNDNKNIYGNKGDYLEFRIDTSDLRGKNIYLAMNSWGSTPLQRNPDYLRAESEESFSVFFYINKSGEYTELNQIHPRELETTAYLDITDLIEKSGGDEIKVKIVWTQEHWIDQISVVTSEENEYRLEELLLTKAEHSQVGDILDSLSQKDLIYANTKQGDEIDLEFTTGRYNRENNEKEAYVFISSGFYNTLSPELEPDNSWQETIDRYVEELNKLK